jgi:hypothetical protein
MQISFGLWIYINEWIKDVTIHKPWIGNQSDINKNYHKVDGIKLLNFEKIKNFRSLFDIIMEEYNTEKKINIKFEKINKYENKLENIDYDYDIEDNEKYTDAYLKYRTEVKKDASCFNSRFYNMTHRLFVNSYGFYNIRSMDYDCLQPNFYEHELYETIKIISNTLLKLKTLKNNKNKKEYVIYSNLLIHFIYKRYYECLKRSNDYFIREELQIMASVGDTCTIFYDYAKNKLAEVVDLRKKYIIKTIKKRDISTQSNNEIYTKRRNLFNEMYRHGRDKINKKTGAIEK